MKSEYKKKLAQLVEQSQSWERIKTSEEGLFIVKVEKDGKLDTVMIELNPSLHGQPLKRHGIYIKTINDIKMYKELLENPKIEELMDIIMEYYGNGNNAVLEL